MKQANRTKNTVRNSFWGFAAQIIGIICKFIFRAVIIRKIGVEYVGLNGLFGSILTVLNMTELGFGSAVIYMMYKPIAEYDTQEIRRLLNAIRKIYKYVGLFILAAGCCVYPFLSILVKNDTGADVNIYVLYSMYLFHTVVSYLASAYRATLFTAHQRRDILSKIRLIMEIVCYSLQAIVLFATKNYYLYLLVYALSVIPTNILYYVYSKKCFPDIYCEGKITDEQKASIKAKVLPLLGHRIGGKIIVSIDDLIISACLGVTMLAQYDNYYYVFHSITTFLSILRSSVIASLGNKLYKASNDEMYKTYKKVFFIWVTIVGWCTCFLIGLYQPFIKMWVGGKYVYDNSIMIWISMYFFVWQFRFIGVTMKDSAGLWEPDRWKPIIGMVLNLGFSILVVKLTGSILGVLIPTMCVMVFIYFPWETHVLFKYIFHRSCREYLMLAAKCVVSFAVSAAAVFAATVKIPLDGIGFFMLRFFLCIFIPAGFIFLFHFKTKQFQNVLQDMKRIVKGLR